MTALPLAAMARQLGQVSTCVHTRAGDPVIIWDVIGNVIYGKIGNYAHQWQLSGHSPEHEGHDLVPIPPATEPTISDEDVREALKAFWAEKGLPPIMEERMRAALEAYVARSKPVPSQPVLSEDEIATIIGDTFDGAPGWNWACVRAILAAGPVERAAEVKDEPRYIDCDECNGHGRPHPGAWNCNKCDGSGRMERPATPKQASGDPAVDRQVGPVFPLGEHKPVAAHWIGKCKICGETFDGGDRNEPPAHTHGRCGGLIRYHRAPPAPRAPSDDVVALLNELRRDVVNYTLLKFVGNGRQILIGRIDAILDKAAKP